MSEKINEKVKDLELAILTIENIRQATEIDRFKFTSQEINSIDFVIKFCKINLEEIKKFDE